MIFSIGSKKIDRFLLGGIRSGVLTDIFGESSSGKSQFCFSLCANILKNHKLDIIFVDTNGTFRPERIIEIIGDQNNISILDSIKYIRPFTFFQQNESLIKIEEIRPKVVIVDSIASLIAVEYDLMSRSLVFMKYLHKLSLLAIKYNIAVIFTNTIRNNINQIKNGETKQDTGKEFMESTLMMYSHFRLKFEKNHYVKNLYKIIFIQPSFKKTIDFQIEKNGII